MIGEPLKKYIHRFRLERAVSQLINSSDTVKNIAFDAFLSVKQGCQVEGDVKIQKIELGMYAKATHFGPYQHLSYSYNKLCGQWIPANEYKIASK